jgi:hypothetical protein
LGKFDMEISVWQDPFLYSMQLAQNHQNQMVGIVDGLKSASVGWDYTSIINCAVVASSGLMNAVNFCDTQKNLQFFLREKIILPPFGLPIKTLVVSLNPNKSEQAATRTLPLAVGEISTSFNAFQFAIELSVADFVQLRRHPIDLGCLMSLNGWGLLLSLIYAEQQQTRLKYRLFIKLTELTQNQTAYFLEP